MIISIGRGGEAHMESSDPATDRSAGQGHSGWQHMASEDTEAATATRSRPLPQYVNHSGQVHHSSLLSTCNSHVYQSIHTYPVQ